MDPAPPLSSTATRGRDEPSALPPAGYVLGVLMSIAAGTLAGGSTLTMAIEIVTSKREALPAGSIVLFGLSPLLLLASLAYSRSTRRHGYSLSAVGAGVLVAVIWLCSMVAAVLVSFGDPFAEIGVDSQIVVGAHRLAQSVLWAYVIVLTVNVCCSPLLGRRDQIGRIARLVFLSTTVLLGLLAIIPAVSTLLLSDA